MKITVKQRDTYTKSTLDALYYHPHSHTPTVVCSNQLMGGSVCVCLFVLVGVNKSWGNKSTQKQVSSKKDARRTGAVSSAEARLTALQ